MEAIDLLFYLTCALWLAYELYLILARKGKPTGETRSNKPFLILFAIAITLAVNLSTIPFLGFPDHRAEFILLGTAVMWLGIALRYWAVRTLDKFFTTVIGMQEGHRLVKEGLYKYVRHPSYTGVVTTALGLGIALHNFLGLAILMVVILYGYNERMDYEEKVLAANFGKEYEEYAKNTKRLIPFVY
jgi:protein-S-isoprenylcysteine O-methyltransferase Ste14